MRRAFVRTITELTERDSRILLLTGDLGYTILEPFADRFPDRFFNVGVAEQNMVGLATGLAEAGFIPFIYSISTFASLRPYEFIRNGPIHARLPVRIVGIGGGFEYGHAGITHHALEDIALMRAQPGITVVAPADYEQAASALVKTWDLPGPIYYRLGKDDLTIIPGLKGRFELGRAQLIGKGRDALIITMGSIAYEAALAIEGLSAKGISSTMMVIASVNPAPIQDLSELLPNFKVAVTVEAHYVNGGIGSMVAEVIAEQNFACKLIRCGVKSPFNGISGSQNFLQHKYGLSAIHLTETISRALGK